MRPLWLHLTAGTACMPAGRRPSKENLLSHVCLPTQAPVNKKYMLLSAHTGSRTCQPGVAGLLLLAVTGTAGQTCGSS